MKELHTHELSDTLDILAATLSEHELIQFQIEKQRQKGLEKYGRPALLGMAPDGSVPQSEYSRTVALRRWVNHLLEELIDGSGYALNVEKFEQSLKGKEERIFAHEIKLKLKESLFLLVALLASVGDSSPLITKSHIATASLDQLAKLLDAPTNAVFAWSAGVGTLDEECLRTTLVRFGLEPRELDEALQQWRENYRLQQDLEDYFDDDQ